MTSEVRFVRGSGSVLAVAERGGDENWIGRRIASLRRERGWTLAVLGQRVELSTTQLSRIESGGRQSSVGTLIEIARAFDMSLSQLVAEEPFQSFQLVRVCDRKPRYSASGVLTSLSGRYPGLDAIHLSILPKTRAPTAQHAGEEWLYVLTGLVEVTLGPELIALESGDALHFPSHTPHSIRNTGASPANVLLISAGSRQSRSARQEAH